jgi:hypothetical protein
MADLGLRKEGADLLLLPRWRGSSPAIARTISALRCGR